MAKKLLLLLIAMTVLMGCVTLIPSNAADGINEAFYVQGGDWIDEATGKKVVIDTPEKLVKCFYDPTADEQCAEFYDGVIHFTVPYIVLTSPIIISDGSYVINGDGCTIFRGFEGGALIGLNGVSGNPSLSIGEAVAKGQSWSENTSEPVLTFDGNSEEFRDNQLGIFAVSGQATLSISGQVVIKNSVSQTGAAIYAGYAEDNSADNTIRSPSVIISDSVIRDCVSNEGGTVMLNGLNSYGELYAENVTFKSNKAISEDLSGYGGAMRTEGGVVELINCAFEKNEANRGGAMYICSEGTATNCSFTENKSTEEGGAICGRVIDNVGVCNVKFESVSINNNSTSGIGGAVSNYGSMKITGYSYVQDNNAKGSGGGIYNDGILEIESINLIGNKSDSVGGGIYCTRNSKNVITDGEIRVNESKYVGGVYCAGEFKMTGGAIGKNKSDFPQVLFKKDAIISKNANISGEDVVGLCLTEKSDGSEFIPYVRVEEALRDGVLINIAICSESTDSNGDITGYKNITKNGSRIYDGKAEIMEETADRFAIQSKGLLSFSLKDDGTLSVKFVFLPIWAWVLIALGIIEIVCLILRKQIVRGIKALRLKFKKKKEPIVHHKKRK